MDLGSYFFFSSPRQGLNIGLSMEELRLSMWMCTHLEKAALNQFDKSDETTCHDSVSVNTSVCVLNMILIHISP